MRVIAGTAKGHRLTAPEGRRVRPTTDRVKEALFSSLQTRLPGARVLDLFAGSGALGIEALSRGAASATFVERDRRALQALRQNLDHTDTSPRARVEAADVMVVLQRLAGDRFDIVLLDPPYDIEPESLAEVLASLAGAVADGGLVVLELGEHSEEPRWPAGLTPGRERHYGSVRLYEATPAGEEPS